MSEKRLYNINDFSKGLNLKDSPSIIPLNALVEAENAVIQKGTISKRSGYERFITTPLTNPVTKLFDFYKSNGSRDLLAVSNNKLYKESGGELTVIPTGSLVSNKVKMLTYKNRFVEDVVLLADQGKLKIYDGGTMVKDITPHSPSTEEQTNPGLNDFSTLTNFRAMTMKKDRIYAAAHPTIKNRVSFSYFDPILGQAVYDYFPAIYFFDVGTEDNDEIVELRVFRDVLVIFMKRSVWALYGDGADLAGLELVKINVPKGCISPGSVQEVGNNLFYLADDHVYSLFSTERNFISAEPVSENIFPILQSIGISDKEKTTAAFHENKYYLSFPSGLTLVYDITLKAWTKFTNVQANSFLARDGVLYFSSNNGAVYRFNENIFTDDGSAIPFVMKTRIVDFEAPIHPKKIRKMWVVQKQWAGYDTSYNLFGMLDQYDLIDLKILQVKSGVGGIWDESNWDDALWDFSQVSQDEIKLRKKAKSIQIQISNKMPNEPITIYGLVLEYQLKKP